MLSLISVGADPEVFLVNEDGSPQSAEGLIGGTKEKPLAIPKLAKGFAVQEDNVAAEYNIPPCTTAETFSIAVNAGLRYLEAIAKKKKLKLAVVAAMEFPIAQLMTDHAQHFGCDPDFNAWTDEMNQPPRANTQLRTAAGHVHFGLNWDEKKDDNLVIKLMDLYLGVPSILVTDATARRKMYGKAGAYRPKPYGVEYRTLDNFWIAHKIYREHIFHAAHTAISTLNGRKRHFTVEALHFWAPEIQHTINEHDKDMALNIMAKLEIPAFPVPV